MNTLYSRLRRILACVALIMFIIPVCAHADLTARFIDVGQGDACLITCDGESMLIDGGTADNSSLLVSLLNSLGIDELRYMINTHPHDDHVGGLCGPLNSVTVDAAYSSTIDYGENYFVSYKSYIERQGLKLQTLSAGDSLSLGAAQIYVISPISDLDDLNDNSIVLRVVYGSTSMLLTGDASENAERALLDSGAELKSDLLKVGHHGAATSSCADFLSAVDPTWAVISVGADNDFGHPREDTLKRLDDVGAQVLRTDENGTVTANSDGQTFTVSAERGYENANDDTVFEGYIGNKNTKKFHKSTCGNLPDEKNRVSLSSRDEAIEQGYSPCGKCKP